MASAAPRKLTPRQRAVLERIDRRVPIKVIAQELGVSETRINQHIRALKDIYKAESLNELVEQYRATLPPGSTKDNAGPDQKKDKDQSLEEKAKGLSEAPYKKNQIPPPGTNDESQWRADRGELVMRDVLPLIEQAPWLRTGEPKVVLGVLDGEHAVLFRLAAILGIAFGVLAAVVLTVTAGVALSEALDSMAQIPAES
jgi:DNA-binding CsgD family transcriptional regulator